MKSLLDDEPYYHDLYRDGFLHMLPHCAICGKEFKALCSEVDPMMPYGCHDCKASGEYERVFGKQRYSVMIDYKGVVE